MAPATRPEYMHRIPCRGEGTVGEVVGVYDDGSPCSPFHPHDYVRRVCFFLLLPPIFSIRAHVHGPSSEVLLSCTPAPASASRPPSPIAYSHCSSTQMLSESGCHAQPCPVPLSSCKFLKLADLKVDGTCGLSLLKVDGTCLV